MRRELTCAPILHRAGFMHRDMDLGVVGGKEWISDLGQRRKTATQEYFLQVSYT